MRLNSIILSLFFCLALSLSYAQDNKAVSEKVSDTATVKSESKDAETKDSGSKDAETKDSEKKGDETVKKVEPEPSHADEIAVIDFGYTGTLALDGYVSILEIYTAVDKDKNAKSMFNIDDILKKKYGKKYKITPIKIKTLVNKSTIVPSYSIDRSALNTQLKKDYHSVVVVNYSWRERTKYVRNSWDKPPLFIDISRTWQFYKNGVEEKSFSYSVVHQEPSDYGKEIEKKKKQERKKTAGLIAGKQKAVMKDISKWLK